MAGIYKAYDIRGIYKENLDEEIIKKIGKAYADILRKELDKDDITIVVGRDMRVSSPSLSQAMIQGITEQGVNVIDVGLVSTPTYYFAVSNLGADGGMQVSASHNPKEYNGVKIVKSKAYPMGYDTGINEVERKVQENDFETSEKKGTVSTQDGMLEKELEFALEHGNLDKIKPLKVVADAANAMGSPYLRALFSKLPNCELVEMNFELDGTFPAHQADPLDDENNADLKEKVKAEGADLGIATDGDGDRIFFIDDKGELVEPAMIRGILAEVVLKDNPGAKICYDIRPGKITYDMITENGGIPIQTRVGHSLIKEQALKEGSPFAGESSGHFFFGYDIGMFEMPMIVTLKILEYISNKGKKFSEITEPLKRYFHSGEINSKVEDKQGTMDKLAEKYSDGKISKLDGVTVEYDDFWFNVRPSNTESLLRLNLEAVSKEVMEAKRDEVLKVIRGE
jgi:phosphomannomutase